MSRPMLCLLFVLASSLPNLASAQDRCVRDDLAANWRDASGHPKYPGDDGFAGPHLHVILEPGTVIDRFSCDRADAEDAGQFFSPFGWGFSKRALPTQCQKDLYRAYEVTEPLDAEVGSVRAYFDQPGGGVQIKTQLSVKDLLALKLIKRLPETAAPCSG